MLRDFRRFVCFVVNSAQTTYNAALNKTAYQSSVLVNSNGRYDAHLANDGSRETRATSYDGVPRCSHSRSEIHPWWAVDLERPTEVYAVNFTNRDGGRGMKNASLFRIYLFYLSI